MHSRSRRRVLIPLVLSLVLVLVTACDGGPEVGGSDDLPTGNGWVSEGVDNTQPDDDPASDDPVDSNDGPATPGGPSGGPQVDADWPEQVWFPDDLLVGGGSFDLTDGAYRVNVLGSIEIDLETVRQLLIAGNGAPDDAGDHASGAYVMSYTDLVPGHTVGFTLDDTSATAGLTAVIVTIFPA